MPRILRLLPLGSLPIKVHFFPKSKRITTRFHHAGTFPVSIERACQCFACSVSVMFFSFSKPSYAGCHRARRSMA
jgi:hypothetical protein